VAPNDHSRTLSVVDDDDQQQQHHGARKSSLSHVDSIIEDEEPKDTAVSPQAVQSRSVPKLPDVRTRSVSTSGISQGVGLWNPGKPSLGLKSPPPSYNAPNSSPATPRRMRKPQRRRESMDIDDIMNGSEDGSQSSPDPGDQPTQGRVPLYPVSKVTKDLISFLEEGPPPEIQPARPATTSTVSLTPTTKSTKSSRLQRMISMLTLSKEDRMSQDTHRARGIGSTSAPSTPLVSSMRSLGTSNVPPLPPPVKPVPPPSLSIPPPAPISPPPSSQPSPDDDARSPITRTDRLPRKLSIRKAVPTWERTADEGPPVPPTKDVPSPRPLPTSSNPLASQTPIPNGLVQPQSPLTPAPEAKEANNHTHDKHKLPRSDSPVAIHTPASTGLETPSHSPISGENGNGLAEQPNPQPISRPQSSKADHRLSMNGEQVNPARQFSGPQSQPPSAQPPPPTPSLSESLAMDMRKLMSHATTADECRLLLDTFLTRAGILSPSSPVMETAPSDVDSLERTLVHHLLGADSDKPQSLPMGPVTTETEQNPLASVAEHPPVQDCNVLQQGTTTPMDSVSAMHAHHFVSATVAVAS